MIVGFIGNRGSGKTASMTRFLYAKYRQGYKIYSNYTLNFPHEKYTLKDIEGYAHSNKKFENSIFAVDEIHVYLDSRVSGRKINRVFSYFVTQTRKKDIDLYYTTQFPRQVDIRMKIHTDMCVTCRSKSLVWKYENTKPKIYNNYTYTGKEYRVLTKIYLTVIEFGYDGDRIKNMEFWANKWFKYYDTSEVIIPFMDDDK